MHVKVTEEHTRLRVVCDRALHAVSRGQRASAERDRRDLAIGLELAAA
jgi:hypothetical protein